MLNLLSGFGEWGLCFLKVRNRVRELLGVEVGGESMREVELGVRGVGEEIVG